MQFLAIGDKESGGRQRACAAPAAFFVIAYTDGEYFWRLATT
jgi:hypothetical protein